VIPLAPLRALRALRRHPTVNAGLQLSLGASPWRHKLPATVWKRVPVHGEFRVDVPGSRGFLYQSRGEPLGKVLFWRGIAGFEPGSAVVFCELATRCRTFLDVGAYSGYYTLLAMTMSDSCASHCFEPVPAIRAWLCRNLELNGVDNRVRIVPAAVSDRGGDNVDFFLSANTYSPGSSLLRDFGTERRSAISLPVTSLDEYVKTHDVRDVDLVKIDTEGAEPQVLQGAQRLLETQRPAVLCEILESDREHLARIEDLLRKANYRHAHITEQGLHRTPQIRPDPTRRLRNFLLWPEERTPQGLSFID
jgi:FkbM family methyltransferase